MDVGRQRKNCDFEAFPATLFSTSKIEEKNCDFEVAQLSHEMDVGRQKLREKLRL